MGFTTADEVIKYIADEGVEYVDVRFSDLPGIQQHFSIPASSFDKDLAEEGLAFDGSSVRGFQSIHESDMLLLPDFSTAQLDPFQQKKEIKIAAPEEKIEHLIAVIKKNAHTGKRGDGIIWVIPIEESILI